MSTYMMRQDVFVTHNSMELASFVALRLALGVFTFAGAKLPEILCSTWGDIGKKFHFHSTQWLACNI